MRRELYKHKFVKNIENQHQYKLHRGLDISFGGEFNVLDIHYSSSNERTFEIQYYYYFGFSSEIGKKKKILFIYIVQFSLMLKDTLKSSYINITGNMFFHFTKLFFQFTKVNSIYYENFRQN